MMIHGYAEHYGRYTEVALAWARQGFGIVRLDLRGHGHSGGPRGHVDQFSDYLGDVGAVLQAVRERQALAEPLFLFGHSLGGLIACHFALRKPTPFRGLLLSSPFLGLLMPLPMPVVRFTTGRIARVAPRLRFPSGLQGSNLTHDLEIARRYDTDPLGFTHVTVGWVDACAAAQAGLQQAIDRLEMSAFCLAAGEDKATDVGKTEALFRRLGAARGELRVLPGLYHELLNETNRREHIETFAKVMLGWSER
jgi:lysophospholipase